MTIEEIKIQDECLSNIHESVFKSYQTLVKVKQMLDRGDSKESIIEFIEFIYDKNLNIF